MRTRNGSGSAEADWLARGFAGGGVVHGPFAQRLVRQPHGVVVRANQDLLRATADRHDDVAALGAGLGAARLVERHGVDDEGDLVWSSIAVSTSKRWSLVVAAASRATSAAMSEAGRACGEVACSTASVNDEEARHEDAAGNRMVGALTRDGHDMPPDCDRQPTIGVVSPLPYGTTAARHDGIRPLYQSPPGSAASPDRVR